jgi:hypothetical protein
MTPKRNRQPSEAVFKESSSTSACLPHNLKCPNGAKEISPGVVLQWPCASTYPGKIVQHIFSLSSSNEERAGVRSSNHHPKYSCSIAFQGDAVMAS